MLTEATATRSSIAVAFWRDSFHASARAQQELADRAALALARARVAIAVARESPPAADDAKAPEAPIDLVMSDAELMEMIERADTDGDGEISPDEFYAIMTKKTFT